MKEELKAGVGLSRKWDAREAGREVAETALEKLEGEKPKFFLLFSTIHYEKYGGFQELLNGVWEVLPEGTPLIGGTVGGFINNFGCYTRGCTALTATSSMMDVSVGVGKNTKRNPRKAGRECAESIAKLLQNTPYKNKLIISMVSGAKTLNFPGLGRKRVVNIPTGKYISRLIKASTTSLQYGLARSTEIYEEMYRYLEEFYIIGGETTDNNEVRENYQFTGKDVHSSSIVALAISTNFDINLISTYDVGCKVKHKARVTKRDCWNHAIVEINGKPARKALLDILGWPEDYLDERIYRRVFFYPIGNFKGSPNPHLMGAFWGDYIILEYPLEDPDIGFLEYSGRTLEESINTVTRELSHKNNLMGIGTACISSIETLGSNVYRVYERLDATLEDTPFVFLYMAGEDIKYPFKKPMHLNYSFNIMTLIRK